MTGGEHSAAIAWAQAAIGSPQAAAELVRSGRNATTYKLLADGAVLAFLKITAAPVLRGERDRLRWLAGRAPAPTVVGFAEADGAGRLVTAPLHGFDLSRPIHTADPHRLVGLLVDALRRLHALDPGSCPFGEREPGAVVAHGDACLPNIVFDGSELAGYLDVGDLGLGRPEVDLAAAVWSLDHNLGAGFGGEFLRAYGWPESDQATVERFRRAYETG